MHQGLPVKVTYEGGGKGVHVQETSPHPQSAVFIEPVGNTLTHQCGIFPIDQNQPKLTINRSIPAEIEGTAGRPDQKTVREAAERTFSRIGKGTAELQRRLFIQRFPVIGAHEPPCHRTGCRVSDLRQIARRKLVQQIGHISI